MCAQTHIQYYQTRVRELRALARRRAPRQTSAVTLGRRRLEGDYRPKLACAEVTLRSIFRCGAELDGASATSSTVCQGRSATGRRSDGTRLIAGGGAGRAMLAI